MDSSDLKSYHLIIPGCDEPTTARLSSSKSDYIFLSGALGIDSENLTLPDSHLDQSKNVLKNLDVILRLASTSFQSVIRAILYVTDISYVQEFDKEFAKYINKDNSPARTNLVVKQLPRGGKVELDLVALVESNDSFKTIPGDKLPGALGPFVTAKRVSRDSNLVFLSGTLGADPKTGGLVSENFGDQLKQTMTNLQNMLARCGSHFGNIVKATIYLTDMSNFGALNEEYSKYFPKGAFPTRTCIAVKTLPRNALVEIDVIAVEQGFKKFQNIVADDIPKAIGPFTMGKKLRAKTPLLFYSSLLGVDEKGDIPDSVVEQTKNIMINFSKTIVHTKASYDRIVKASVFLTDMGNFGQMNEEYSKWFQKGKEPTRLCVAVPALPKSAKVLMEFVVADPKEIKPKL